MSVSKFKLTDFSFIIVLLVILSIIFGIGIFVVRNQTKEVGETMVSEIVGEKIKTLADGTKYIIHPNELLSGGPPKGGIGFDRGIPSLVDPKFISADKATWLTDNDLVFGIFSDGIAKAYPKQILVWHEIVNDEINGRPILVTYCPLCGTAIAFERAVNGEVLKFGTSGKLYNSNLVMYDDKTESYWTQVGGKAIIGELTGTKLKQIPIDTMLWKNWKELYPTTLVLSKDTGFSRSYGYDPYGNYYSSSSIGFGASFNDDRLHPKAMVSGLEIGNKTKAYPVSEIKKIGVLNDEFGGLKLLVVIDPEIEVKDFEVNPIRIFNRLINGNILEFKLQENELVDKQTNSEWNFDGEAISGTYKGTKLEQIPAESSMWFAWLSFHPDTEIFLP